MRRLALLLSLLLPLSLLAGAAQIARADAADLKLATWNLGWLTVRPLGDPALPGDVGPTREADIARLASYAAALDADVVAFQGIDGAVLAARLFPPERYVIQISGDAVLQRVGFAVRRGLAFTANADVATLDPYPHARFRLRSGVDITLAGGLRLLAVHLKSGCRDVALDTADRPACATLGLQADALSGWMAARDAAGQAFAVLGDFGRVMDGADDFLARAEASIPLLRATEGHASPCWGGAAFTDHVLLGGAARGWLLPDTLRVMVYRETGETWRGRLPDHCPLSIRLHLAD